MNLQEKIYYALFKEKPDFNDTTNIKLVNAVCFIMENYGQFEKFDYNINLSIGGVYDDKLLKKLSNNTSSLSDNQKQIIKSLKAALPYSDNQINKHIIIGGAVIEYLNRYLLRDYADCRSHFSLDMPKYKNIYDTCFNYLLAVDKNINKNCISKSLITANIEKENELSF